MARFDDVERGLKPPLTQYMVLSVQHKRDQAKLLIRNNDAEVKVEELNQDIWKNKGTVESQAIVQHITNLRRKLREKPRSPKTLVFQDGGYRLFLET